MTGVDSYSTTPATNATDTGGSVNWAEGQAPSTVNNSARQLIADLRAAFNDLIWFQYGTGDQGAGNIAVPSVYASATSFTIAGADVTAVYHANRRVRAVGSATGTIYGKISSSSYNGGNTTTTVNVTWDSGSLSNETLVISLSQIPATGSPLTTGTLTSDLLFTDATYDIGKSGATRPRDGFFSRNVVVGGTLTPSSTSGIVGTTTNDSANAGSAGEYQHSDVVSGSAVAFVSSGTTLNLTSMSLTAGDWEVYCLGEFTALGATTAINLGISTTSASNTGLPGTTAYAQQSWASMTPPNDTALLAGPARISLASTTTVYGVATCFYTTGSPKIFGQMRARRVR